MEFLDTFDSVTFIPFTTLNYVSLATIIEISLDLILLRVTVNEYRRETGVSSRLGSMHLSFFHAPPIELPPKPSSVLVAERAHLHSLADTRATWRVCYHRERERERRALKCKLADPTVLGGPIDRG